MVAGQQNIYDNLQVQYTYHVHDGDGTSESECYSAVYHTHSSSCYRTCTGSKIATAEGTESGSGYKGPYKCNSCGITGTDYGSYKQFVGQNFGTCGRSILKCSISTSTISGYEVSCGKTEETIESATIIY